MSRPITYSRTYPSYHPKAGEPTHFVEKIWNEFCPPNMDYKMLCDLNPDLSHDILFPFWKSIDKDVKAYKKHTVRSGHRWKKGDIFSPRVWGNDVNPKSGRKGPYHSKQIIIAPDTVIKNVWDISFDGKEFKMAGAQATTIIQLIANNDGLLLHDFKSWFPKPFDGQIISWSPIILY
jgi:hypothetical protein